MIRKDIFVGFTEKKKEEKKKNFGTTLWIRTRPRVPLFTFFSVVSHQGGVCLKNL